MSNPHQSTHAPAPRNISPKVVALVTFEGVQVLGITGPASVFSTANDAVGMNFYDVMLVSVPGGILRSGNGVSLDTQAMANVPNSLIDTLLIGGGDRKALVQFIRTAPVGDWLHGTADTARRYGSVCTGAFVLAHFGLIERKKVTTHWDSCGLLSQIYPSVSVDPDVLFIQDGKVWTSGGVTTGIDMCLAMVEEDLGIDVANSVAKKLVLYIKRAGHQSQFSEVLCAQTSAGDEFSSLVDWINANLGESLDVGQLAQRASMSERSFHRKFTEALGETPARFVETLRLERAKQLLSSSAGLKKIAKNAGFTSAQALINAFQRRYGTTPGTFRIANRQTTAARVD